LRNPSTKLSFFARPPHNKKALPDTIQIDHFSMPKRLSAHTTGQPGQLRGILKRPRATTSVPSPMDVRHAGRTILLPKPTRPAPSTTALRNAGRSILRFFHRIIADDATTRALAQRFLAHTPDPKTLKDVEYEKLTQILTSADTIKAHGDFLTRILAVVNRSGSVFHGTVGARVFMVAYVIHTHSKTMMDQNGFERKRVIECSRTLLQSMYDAATALASGVSWREAVDGTFSLTRDMRTYLGAFRRWRLLEEKAEYRQLAYEAEELEKCRAGMVDRDGGALSERDATALPMLDQCLGSVGRKMAALKNNGPEPLPEGGKVKKDNLSYKRAFILRNDYIGMSSDELAHRVMLDPSYRVGAMCMQIETFTLVAQTAVCVRTTPFLLPLTKATPITIADVVACSVETCNTVFSPNLTYARVVAITARHPVHSWLQVVLLTFCSFNCCCTSLCCNVCMRSCCCCTC